MSQHTPTPWTATTRQWCGNDGCTLHPEIVITTNSGQVLFTINPHHVGVEAQPEDAELIVRAVNCHEALVEALGAAQWLLDDSDDAGQNHNPETGTEYDSAANARAALAKARAALATGGQS